MNKYEIKNIILQTLIEIDKTKELSDEDVSKITEKIDELSTTRYEKLEDTYQNKFKEYIKLKELLIQ
jgi:hypothetical protein